MIIKCKMCGGNVEILQDQNIAVCEYCGSKMTIPRIDDEKKMNLYNRANHFRLQNDYDKALLLYERILEDCTNDPEIYWSILLCRYGIEYVEEPSDGRRIPTCHRTLVSSILNDPDYFSVLKYADQEACELYRKEASVIDGIQKNILSMSQNSDHYDIFICYKESDDYGKRTIDSVVAQDLYDKLEAEGFSVFFARQTLKNVPGKSYEPYIYSALRTSRIMIAVGSCKEYFEAVWVKNEWKRFLNQIQSGENKILIPAYKGMDPYDLPEEIAHLQAQDMNNIGFFQDLLRGIKRFWQEDFGAVRTDNRAEESRINGYIEMGFQQLEMGDKEEAVSCFQKAVLEETELGIAYLGLMAADVDDKKAFYYGKLTEYFKESDDAVETKYINQAVNSIMDFLIPLIKFQDEKRVKKCVDTGGDLNVEIENLTPLCYAVQTGNDDIVRCICEGNADPDYLCEDGKTCALGEACNVESEEIVRYLLQNGANPDLEYGDKEYTRIPMLRAIELDFAGGAEAMIDYGVDPCGSYKKTEVIGKREKENELFFLAYAIKQSSKQVFELLIEKGADLNSFSNKIPTFLSCIDSSDPSMIDYVIERGADLNITWNCEYGSVRGWNRLFGRYKKAEREWCNNQDVVQYALDHGAYTAAEKFIAGGCRQTQRYLKLLAKWMRKSWFRINLFILPILVGGPAYIIYNDVPLKEAISMTPGILGMYSLTAGIIIWALDMFLNISILPYDVFSKKFYDSYQSAKKKYKFLKRHQ